MTNGGMESQPYYLENIVYHFFRQLWLFLRVKLMEINSNLFSRYVITVYHHFEKQAPQDAATSHAFQIWKPSVNLEDCKPKIPAWCSVWTINNIPNRSLDVWKLIDFPNSWLFQSVDCSLEPGFFVFFGQRFWLYLSGPPFWCGTKQTNQSLQGQHGCGGETPRWCPISWSWGHGKGKPGTHDGLVGSFLWVQVMFFFFFRTATSTTLELFEIWRDGCRLRSVICPAIFQIQRNSFKFLVVLIEMIQIWPIDFYTWVDVT